MTAADLRRFLDAVGAADRGGELHCRCWVCQPDEGSPAEYRCQVKPGRRYPVLVYCFRCCQPGDREGNRRWWSEFQESVPEPLPEPCLRPVADAAAVERVWAEIDYRADAAPVATPDVLHAVYTQLLDALELTDGHRRWLRRRGLDPDWAFAAGYRTSSFDYRLEGRERRPVGDGDGGSTGRSLQETLDALYARFGFGLAAVPGFEFDGTAVRLRSRAPAVLTPCRDAAGRVFALKHRMLDGGGTRMRLLSSRPVGGPRAVVGVHHPLGVGGHRWPTVWVTEGERKADVHWVRTGRPTVAIAGTGTWRQAVPAAAATLAEPGGGVVVALDQDPAGRRASRSLAAALAAAGLRASVASWSGRKGLDDAVVGGVEVRVEAVAAPEIGPPPSPRCPDRPRLFRLAEDEIVPYVRDHGPVLADDLPAYPLAVTRLVRAGRLAVSYTPKGQLLRALP